MQHAAQLIAAGLAEMFERPDLSAFSDEAGRVIARMMAARDVDDPSDLDPAADAMLRAAWAEAAVVAFPHRQPAHVVAELDALFDAAVERHTGSAAPAQ